MLQGFARVSVAVPACRVGDVAFNIEETRRLWVEADAAGSGLVTAVRTVPSRRSMAVSQGVNPSGRWRAIPGSVAETQAQRRAIARRRANSRRRRHRSIALTLNDPLAD